MVEGIQKEFLLFALQGLRRGTNTTLPLYEQHLLLIYLPTLERRKLLHGIGFFMKPYSRSYFLITFQEISYLFSCRNVGVSRVVCKQLNLLNLFSINDASAYVKSSSLNCNSS